MLFRIHRYSIQKTFLSKFRIIVSESNKSFVFPSVCFFLIPATNSNIFINQRVSNFKFFWRSNIKICLCQVKYSSWIFVFFFLNLCFKYSDISLKCFNTFFIICCMYPNQVLIILWHKTILNHSWIRLCRNTNLVKS